MTPITYAGFAILTLSFVSLDIWQTRGPAVSMKRALVWSLLWLLLALIFAASIYFFWGIYAPQSHYSGQKATVAFLTGYLLEKSLSVDNLFVFATVFHQYSVPEPLRPRALLWGVVGALILRAAMIMVGAELLASYHWLLYVFALFLIWTGIQLVRDKNAESINPMPERVVRRLFPVTEQFSGNALWVRYANRWWVTPMFIVVGVIAFMDVIFALDSIPAIFAVTQEPFLVLAANVFALLGLRSLYFVLQGMMDKFIYLKPALSFIMVFIGAKMLLMGSGWAIPTSVSLLVLLLTMVTAIVASAVRGQSQVKMSQVKSGD